jgi:hypothetical protein
MSKGYGKIQRRLLEILNDDERLFETFELAAAIFDVEPARLNAAQLVTVRRALQKLAGEGAVVDLGRRGWSGGRRRWASERAALRYKIHAMQEENAADAAQGNRSAAAIKNRAREMRPLINRARDLGIDYSVR